MRQRLYPHNQIAYEKVMKAFETSNRTCICHPTGTGKSYIVAAVCQHFNKILVIAPNIFVLNQQEKVLKDRSDISYTTYAWLLNNYSSINNQYDLIVLDEFHRAGAEEWGTAVNLLLESQPQAKVLGTSATPIRYLDDNKDMSDELFDGNVASTLTIAEAWHQRILPIPTYVTGFFSFDNIVNDAIDKINANTQINEEVKEDRLYKLNNLKLDWEESSGMVNILQKHLGKNAHRIVVFCAHIDQLQKMQTLAKKWFKESGFKISGTYTIHSNQSDNEQIKQMRRFSSGNYKGIKLLFVVNILNEGVHIPDVDAVLMLRTTSSKIIYLQQFGRCLTAANSDKPLVLDMVDNITTTSIEPIVDELKRLEGERKGYSSSEDSEYEPVEFEIFDYTLNLRQIVEKLTYQYLTLDERIERMTEFCKTHGRAPSKIYPEEMLDKNVWGSLYNYIETDSRVLDLFVKYGSNHFLPVFKQRIINYINEHDIFPTNAKSSSLAAYFCNNKKKLLKDKDLYNLYQEYSLEGKGNKIKEVLYQKVLRYCQKYNIFPLSSGKSKEEKEAYEASQRISSYKDPRIKDLRKRYGRKSVIRRVKIIEEFAEKHGYLPYKAGHQMTRLWKELRKRYSSNQEVQLLLNKYGNITKEIVHKNRVEICRKTATDKSIIRKFPTKKVLDVSTGKIYNSITEACKELSIKRSTLRLYLKKGELFKFAD